ncbi:hypothetical protein CH75_08280 [Dyella jiangningensis]|uniref:YciE/YciF ferroxidase family protein n=1 Tax=Dyella jiangningensis TaxID=1379159 RepID=UPI0004563F04|nr:DUF892 family protein [Dyella jiangningensis]AHX13228.1 hypothetical protein CH75_08280 [Dyella jiangningensis]MDG2538852.1 DUF892 family protein [Dyella jiangningensis]
MTEARELLIDWIRNAHAMEVQSEELLVSQLRRIEHYPDLRDRLKLHRDETRSQRAILEDLLHDYRTTPSAWREAGVRLMALGQNMFQVASNDEVVKGAIMLASFERMEMSVYRALSTAAQVAGETALVDIFDRLYGQEQAMATWHDEHLADLVRQFVVRSELPDVTARH